MPEGGLVHASELPERRAPGDTAAVRDVFGPEQGCDVLEQRVIACAPGRSAERETGDAEEVLYVLAGAGTIAAAGAAHAVEPDAGVLVAPGERYAVDNPGPQALVLVSVRIPDPGGRAGAPRTAVARLADQETGQATADREFRIVADPGSGCHGATQFVGYIPPGRAPEHYHRYDEVIYVLRGEGLLHLGGEPRPFGAGSCIHLPREVRHSLENVGETPMQVLGVFRPAGSPSEAYYPDGTLAMSPGERPRA